jgi:Ca2+/Na+ antiporter
MILLKLVGSVLLSIVFFIGFIIFYASRHTDAEVGQLSEPLLIAGSMAAAALVVFGTAALRGNTNQKRNWSRRGVGRN